MMKKILCIVALVAISFTANAQDGDVLECRSSNSNLRFRLDYLEEHLVRLRKGRVEANARETW